MASICLPSCSLQGFFFFSFLLYFSSLTLSLNLKNEAYILAALLVYVGLAMLGKIVNRQVASRWLGSLIPLLRSQFALVGTRPLEGALITADGGNRYWTYASGRRHVKGLQVCVDCRPRSDVFLLAYEFGRSLLDLTWTGAAGDFVELEFILGQGFKEDFVWAVADKKVMNALSKSRWDVVRPT
jgi:hypothetical protein